MIFSRGQNLPKSACRILFGEVEGHGTRTSSDDNCVKVSDSERCQVLHQFFFFVSCSYLQCVALALARQRTFTEAS